MMEAFEVIKTEVEMAKSEGKKLVFALMLDEMNIRKQVLWSDSKQKFTGYVDYGYGQEEGDCPKEAANALVFFSKCCK